MLFKKIFGGNESDRSIKKFESLVEHINRLEPELSAFSPEELRRKSIELKEAIVGGKALDDALEEGFALVREASKRTLGQRHFDVQLLGGITMHRRSIAEMKTGEGKTLVATLPAYLNALAGKGVHVVTVNDYLARRDAVWMGQIYYFLGLSVGCITSDGSYMYDPLHVSNQVNKDAHNDSLDQERDTLGSFKVMHEFLRPCSRREAYNADITYGTNSEFGFDYLRDNTAVHPSQLRQRGHYFAIVDEIDSILIDEARTPLIISMPSTESEDLYKRFADIARSLTAEEDYTVDEKFKSVALTDHGIEKTEKALGIENIYTDAGIKYVHHLETAVRAKALYHRDKEYVVKPARPDGRSGGDGEVIIVDEFTGRLQPGRRWSEGLHQAIEAREGVSVQSESRTAASITYQNYFRMYEKLAGMTGTALTSSEEFLKVYGLDVIAIPTNMPIARSDHNDLIFQTEQGKFRALARYVKELHEKGQPVLIGTVSVERNEFLSEYLRTEGVPHEVLNAKNHEREGEIIAQAGRKGAVTVATNMAGRGVDIKLGGNPAPADIYEAIKGVGGLFVIGTERHEARRIDNQLRGRAGRQGDPGETQFFVSLEDALMRVFASDMIKNMMGRFGIPEDEPIENRIITRSLESAQTKIEGFNFDARKRILEYDDVLNHQRATVYERRRAMLVGSDQDVATALEAIVGDDAELTAVIEERKQTLGEAEFYAVVRRLILQTIDAFWIDHLEMMDYLRGSVGLRAYGQRDPLVEYKKEGLRLFRDMQEAINGHILSMLPHIGAGAFTKAQEEMRKLGDNLRVVSGEAAAAAGGSSVGTVSFSSTMATQGSAQANVQPLRAEEKVGRNDPCPCGSGKKYKKCHGR